MHSRAQIASGLLLLAVPMACSDSNVNVPGEQQPTKQALRDCVLRRLPPKALEERQVSGHDLVTAYLSCQQQSGHASAPPFRSIVEEIARPDSTDPSLVHLLPAAVL